MEPVGHAKRLRRLSCAFRLTLEKARDLSPSHQIKNPAETARRFLKDVNVRLMVGAQESPVFLQQSKEFFDLLGTLGLLIDPGYHVIDDMDHFALIESLDDPDSALCKLLCLWMGLAVG